MTPTDNSNFFKDVVEGSSEKVIIAKFTAPWCAPCKALNPTLEKVISENADVAIYSVNIDDNAALAETYSIRSIPTLLFFRNGHIVETTVGNVHVSKINEGIEKARNDAKAL